MKLKRTLDPATNDYTIAILHQDNWISLKQVLSTMTVLPDPILERYATEMIAFLGDASVTRQVQEYLQTTKYTFSPVPDTGAPVLPFQPTSYRDFMLSEQHYLDAGRGYLKKFRPGLSKVVGLYEKLFGTFPALKPKPLWYQKPIYYTGNHLNFVTSDTDIAFPSYSKALDYELELGFFIVKPLKDATPAEAIDAIGGFVVFNDFSARDVQIAEMDSGFGPQKSKHFVNAMSPVVTTAADILPVLGKLKAEVLINGQSIARTSTSHFRFSLGEALAHVSSSEQLYPGEFFGSGTLPGGCGMEKNIWLKKGQTVELKIQGIGTLKNQIV